MAAPQNLLPLAGDRNAPRRLLRAGFQPLSLLCAVLPVLLPTRGLFHFLLVLGYENYLSGKNGQIPSQADLLGCPRHYHAPSTPVNAILMVVHCFPHSLDKGLITCF